MDTQLLLSKPINPTPLFFALGIVAFRVKSDPEISPSTVKFISLYLLSAIDIPMARGVTFPLNITVGMPLCFTLITATP